MNLLRKILFPVAAIYGAVTLLRNFLYDRQYFKSRRFDIPVIAVGNLSVGGTGKSPQIEYLIRLLSPQFKVATLSRGYKRKTEGFILADRNATAETLGDEPFQFYRKFPHVKVAVDANRADAIKRLLLQAQKPEVILLDDAFQHRKVGAGFYILLTAYNDLYVDDFLLPTGNLRESRRGAKRASIIIVTKCPPDLSVENRLKIQLRLKPESGQHVFFSYIDYDTYVYSANDKIAAGNIKETSKVLLAGIAKPDSFFNFLQGGDDVLLKFSDHHHFSDNEISEIVAQASGRPIVTTEKDYVRLINRVCYDQLYYLPIQSTLVADADKFDAAIVDYVCSFKPSPQ
ncbi:MAG TPA: tetraacyldisaccharide 4'-kinase [Flavobacterium sp.]|jgi:tetraacyldisaccharide 4'-kinase